MASTLVSANVAKSLVDDSIAHQSTHLGKNNGSKTKYDLEYLLQSLLLTKMLRDQKSLPKVLVRSVALLLGHEAATALQKSLESKTLQVPSAPTLSRARLKADVLMMLAYQRLRKERGASFVFISADASPQGGRDCMMVLEDSVSREKAGLVIDADEDELSAWGEAGHLQTHVLPLTRIGSGKASLANKFAAFMHAAKLDVGSSPDCLAGYSRDIVAYCSDYGTESGFTQVQCPANKSYNYIPVSRVPLRTTHMVLVSDQQILVA